MVIAKDYPLRDENDIEEIESKLYAQRGKISRADTDQIRKYTGTTDMGDVPNSRGLNNRLITGQDLLKSHQRMHDAIMSNTHLAGHDLHVYSGGANLGALALSHPKYTFHSPAHISATIDSEQALDHATWHYNDHVRNKDRSSTTVHVSKFHIKPHHRVLFVGDMSELPEEREIILPHRTTFKYQFSTTHPLLSGAIRSPFGTYANKVAIHHFKVTETPHSKELHRDDASETIS